MTMNRAAITDNILRQIRRAFLSTAALTLLSGCPQPVPEEPVVEATVEPVVDAVEQFEPDPFADPVDAPPTIAPAPAFSNGDVDDAIAAALTGDLQSAKTEFQRLLEDPELGTYAAYNLGVIAYREGQVLQATSYFEDALDKDPTHAAPLAALVRDALRTGNSREAQRLVDVQMSRSENAPEIRAVGLYVLNHDGRHEQVIRDGREILLQDEENLDVFFNIAVAYRETARPELAQFILEQGLGRDRSRVEFSLALGQLRMEEGNLTAAQTQFSNALEVDPFNAEAHNNLGLVRLRLRNYSRAEESFVSAAQYAPEYAEAWLNIGNARKGQQNYAGAQVAFEEALSIRSDFSDAYYNLAILYLDAEMGGLEKRPRLEQSISYFDSFARGAGAIPADHPYHGYRAEAETLLRIEIEFQEEAANAPADVWGDDSSEGDDSSDDWGDDSSDDWGDDSSDDWGDDSSDDWGDDSSDDSEDDWGDDSSDDWGDDSSDDWGDDSSDESGEDEEESDEEQDSGDDSEDDWGDSDDWTDAADGEDPW
jgi:Tfp pilus assembly protein PilF